MLQFADGWPLTLSLNGEQYLEVDDDKLELLKEYERQGLIDFRNKPLIDTPHGLQPDMSGVCLTNRY